MKNYICLLKPVLILIGLLLHQAIYAADKETWLVATEPTYAPFEFRDENGKVVGFDVDLIQAIAANQGVEAKVLPQQWDGIFDSLEDGSRDIVAAGVTLTPKRQEKMAMSAPYLDNPVLIIYTDKALNIRSVDDIKNLKVSFLSNTTYGNTLATILNDKQKLLPEKTQFLAFADIVNGKAQATMGPAAVLRYYVKRYTTKERQFYTYQYSTEGGEQVAFAMQKYNKETLKKVNDGLKNIQANGTYQRIYDKWFAQ